MFKYKKTTILIYCIYFVFIILFSYFFIGAEDYVYTCDFSEQNLIYFDFFGRVFNGNIDFFTYLSDSVKNTPSYNVLSVLALLPFYAIFGEYSRLGFIYGIQFFYMVPLTFIILKYIFSKYTNGNEDRAFCSYIIASVLFMPVLWFVSLRGYAAETLAYILMFLLFTLYGDKKLYEKQSVKSGILLGFLLYLMYVIRRIMFSADLCIVLILFLTAVYEIFKNAKSDGKTAQKFGNLFKNLIIIPGITFFSAFSLLQFEQIFRFINSGDIYSGYRQNFLECLSCTTERIGLFKIFLVFAGIFSVFLFGHKTAKRNMVFLSGVTFSFYIAISLYQWSDSYFGTLLVLLSVIIIAGTITLYGFIREKTGNKYISSVFLGIITIYLTTNFFFTFIPVKNKPRIFKPYPAIQFMPSVPYQLADENRENFSDIYFALKDEIRGTDKKIAVFCVFDEVMTWWMLRSMSAFDDKLIENHLNPVTELFNYEGIPIENLDADYVVVSDPVRPFFNRNKFLPLFVPAESFINNKNIAKSYVCIKKNTFSATTKLYYEPKKTTVYLFKKVKPVTAEQVRELYDEIAKEAPEYKHIYDEKVKEYKKSINQN